MLKELHTQTLKKEKMTSGVSFGFQNSVVNTSRSGGSILSLSPPKAVWVSLCFLEWKGRFICIYLKYFISSF